MRLSQLRGRILPKFHRFELTQHRRAIGQCRSIAFCIDSISQVFIIFLNSFRSAIVAVGPHSFPIAIYVVLLCMWDGKQWPWSFNYETIKRQTFLNEMEYKKKTIDNDQYLKKKL